MEVLQPPNPLTTTAAESYDTESDCSTPYVSAPSSPARAFDSGHAAACGYFCSAPTSPMHYVLSMSSARSSGFVPSPSETAVSGLGTFEFDFSASCNETAAKEIESMSTADELFLNGQIRPLKPSETDFDLRSENVFVKSRDLRLWNKFVHRRARSMSPMRDTASFDWSELVVKGEEEEKSVLASEINGDCGAGDTNLSSETTPSASTSSSRCSSAGRSTNRWIFLKEFLRSKSEGRSNHKFWTNISFSPAKVKKPVISSKKKKAGKEAAKKPPSTAAGKRRVPLSAHELHYTANRAQAEKMRKKTYLPYRQGLLGCLGFSSKSYGAMNGFARALNPVSSR